MTSAVAAIVGLSHAQAKGTLHLRMSPEHFRLLSGNEHLAHDTYWGGYAGYFQDPDGHLWEVAWNPQWVVEE